MEKEQKELQDKIDKLDAEIKRREQLLLSDVIKSLSTSSSKSAISKL